MKRTLLTIATLALLAGKSALVQAGDTGNMPGMDMPGMTNQTNPPAESPNATVKPYPLTTCIVSGEKIGEMGKPPVVIYKGQEMKFCCKDCVKDFNKDPDKWIKKLAEEQAKKQKETK